jgi:hypothetical protein
MTNPDGQEREALDKVEQGWPAYRDRIARENGVEVRPVGDGSGGTVHTLFVGSEQDSSDV